MIYDKSEEPVDKILTKECVVNIFNMFDKVFVLLKGVYTRRGARAIEEGGIKVTKKNSRRLLSVPTVYIRGCPVGVAN